MSDPTGSIEAADPIGTAAFVFFHPRNHCRTPGPRPPTTDPRPAASLPHSNETNEPRQEAEDMSVLAVAASAAGALPGAIPCRDRDPELWFADDQTSVDAAQRLCRACPLRAKCLDSAIARREPCGVWGGELFQLGEIVAMLKPKGRPRKDASARAEFADAALTARLISADRVSFIRPRQGVPVA